MSVAALSGPQQARALTAALEQRKGCSLPDADAAPLAAERSRGLARDEAQRAETAERDLAETVGATDQDRVGHARIDPAPGAGEGLTTGCTGVRDRGGGAFRSGQCAQGLQESVARAAGKNVETRRERTGLGVDAVGVLDLVHGGGAGTHADAHSPRAPSLAGSVEGGPDFGQSLLDEAIVP